MKQAAGLIILFLGLASRSMAAPRVVTVDCRVFPGLAEMDGNWAALKVAHDGRVYAGLACHGCDGHLVSYDPTTDRVTDLGDLTWLSGESALHGGPQLYLFYPW